LPGRFQRSVARTEVKVIAESCSSRERLDIAATVTNRAAFKPAPGIGGAAVVVLAEVRWENASE